MSKRHKDDDKERPDDEEKWQRARERALADIATVTDDEDARLTAAAQGDPDNPPLDEHSWRNARRLVDVKPEFVKRMRGQRGPQKAPTKQLISLRLDPDVLDHFRQSGRGWQARINAALRKAAKLDG